MMEELLMLPEYYIIASVVLFLIGFVGFFANLMVIVMMCRDQQLWTPLNYILFNLIMSDFSVSLLGNPFTLASAIAKKWIFGQTMCIAYGFFMALLGITSISTLTLLALERYMMISRPLNSGHLTSKSAFTLVAAVWAYSLTVTVPPLFGWGEYGTEAANISCSVNWETRSHSSTSYIVFMFVFGFFLPLFIITFSYINIIRTMKQSSMEMGRVSKAESRVAWMIAVMILAFFIAWTPYAILALLIAFLNADISPALATVPAIFAKTSICYNPIIYVGLNTQFKQSWLRLLHIRTGTETSVDGVTTALSGFSPRRARISNFDVSVSRSTKVSLFSKNTNSETII